MAIKKSTGVSTGSNFDNSLRGGFTFSDCTVRTKEGVAKGSGKEYSFDEFVLVMEVTGQTWKQEVSFVVPSEDAKEGVVNIFTQEIHNIARSLTSKEEFQAAHDKYFEDGKEPSNKEYADWVASYVYDNVKFGEDIEMFNLYQPENNVRYDAKTKAAVVYNRDTKTTEPVSPNMISFKNKDGKVYPQPVKSIMFTGNYIRKTGDVNVPFTLSAGAKYFEELGKVYTPPVMVDDANTAQPEKGMDW